MTDMEEFVSVYESELRGVKCTCKLTIYKRDEEWYLKEDLCYVEGVLRYVYTYFTHQGYEDKLRSVMGYINGELNEWWLYDVDGGRSRAFQRLCDSDSS